jgi:hypothetical protein
LLVLRYRASPKASPGLDVYRPTQLEAGDFPFHFPSPDCAERRMGGHPVNFGLGLSDLLVSEFIHREIRFHYEHWRDAGDLLERADSVNYGHLMGYRRRHYLVLKQEYGEENVENWMRDPVKLPQLKRRGTPAAV